MHLHHSALFCILALGALVERQSEGAPTPPAAPTHAVADRPPENAGCGSVEYLGNEGLFVSYGDSRILFDPFFEEDFDGNYTLVPDAKVAELMAGRPPYDGIDAIFVSHIHPDHFSSGRIIEYLRAHPTTHLFSTREVYDAIRAAGVRSTDPLMRRLHSIYVPRGAPPHRSEHAGLRLEAYPIAHGRRPIEHLAFRVTMDEGVTVMHLGDAGGDDEFYAPYQSEFDRTSLHALFAPEWLLLEPAQREGLSRRFRARRTIGIHAYSATPAGADRGGHRLFSMPGESLSFGCDGLPRPPARMRRRSDG